MNISGFVKEEVFERKDLDYDNFLCLYFSYLFNLEKNKYEWGGEMLLCQENGHVKQREIAEIIQLFFSG
jgi:hypothetical protein